MIILETLLLVFFSGYLLSSKINERDSRRLASLPARLLISYYLLFSTESTQEIIRITASLMLGHQIGLFLLSLISLTSSNSYHINNRKAYLIHFTCFMTMFLYMIYYINTINSEIFLHLLLVDVFSPFHIIVMLLEDKINKYILFLDILLWITIRIIYLTIIVFTEVWPISAYLTLLFSFLICYQVSDLIFRLTK